MTLAYLAFLYPMKNFTTAVITESAIQTLRLHNKILLRHSRQFTKVSRRQAGLVNRHGKAVEPHTISGENPREKPRCEELRVLKKNKKVKINSFKQQPATLLVEKLQSASEVEKTQEPEKGVGSQIKNSTDDVNIEEPLSTQETVPHLPSTKTIGEQNASRSSNIPKQPYVHHFDTYTLVQRFHEGGFTVEQSITTMKAIRALLSTNLRVARSSLVSKSDVENKTYLFRAACSELKTEIQSMRLKNEEAMRRERSLLQHEVDILSQKLSQELLALKEELKGMFDDRKMLVRVDQRSVDSKIQELNYKITVLLQSDSKSEIEGLRWVLTRRSVMGILFMAFMVLTSLQYASYKSHENELRKKRDKVVIKSEENLNTLPPQGAVEILAAS